jgi:NAD(P)-dependent dehydrogenase (short-subunit alcohol dehydrogenase family)
MPTSTLESKVFIVTGANTGIGRITATELARRGAHVILACRSAERTTPVVDAIRRLTGNDKVDFLPIDLADLGSVRSAAAAFLSRNLPLHGLINNAGLAGKRGLTKDGFEVTFGSNHLGPFLFTLLLLDRLKESAPSRIVNVASRAHKSAKGIDWEALRRPGTSRAVLNEYAVSKLANVLFTKELARRLVGTGVTTYSLHPGVVATDIWRSVPWGLRGLVKLFMISPEQGALTTLHCAASPETANDSALYYEECKVRHPSRTAQDPALAAALWERSVEWTNAPTST